MLDKYLSKFEQILDLQHLQHVEKTCWQIFKFIPVLELPYIRLDTSQVSDVDWPNFEADVCASLDASPPQEESDLKALDGASKQLLFGLWEPFIHHQLKDYRAISVTCEVGKSLIPSIFGLPSTVDDTGTRFCPPLSSPEDVWRLIAKGNPDIMTGLGSRCFKMAEYFQSVLADYPKLEEAICLEPPMLPSPFDAAHQIWGHEIFNALYDQAELVHELLSLITNIYLQWISEWKARFDKPRPYDLSTHRDFYIRGGLVIHELAGLSLSREHYEVYIKPYHQKLFAAFGGCIVFSGRMDHIFETMLNSKGLYSLQCLRPELNDMTTMLQLARSKNIVLLGLPQRYVTRYLNTGVITLK